LRNEYQNLSIFQLKMLAKGSFLNDVSWFASTKVSKAVQIDAKVSLEEYILGSRGLNEVEGMDVPYPLHTKIIMPKDFCLNFQIDRYSELEPVREFYEISGPPEVIDIPLTEWNTNIIDEWFEKGWVEFESHDDVITLTFPRDTEFALTTVGTILQKIYDFYQTHMSEEELEVVSKLDDGWGYSEHARDALSLHKKIQRHEVMGDCMHFEGLVEESYISNGHSVYTINFGS
jgi:hypothetical protein